jgi:hypothetical protein
MITSFDDFCLWTYVTVAELWEVLTPLCQRPGPAPACTDAELITMLLVGECCGWDAETELLARFGEHRDLFPHLPERSRLNRRRRLLADPLNVLRQLLLGSCELALDRQCAIDSLPVPVMTFQRVPASPSVADWKAAGATFGRVPSKRQTIFGYKLTLLATLGGVIRDFVLAPANAADVAVGEELLLAHHDLLVLGDKGYVSQPVAERLWRAGRVRLLALRRANQHEQLPDELRTTITRLRQVIETVNGQLTEQFQIGRNHAFSFAGLCARLHTKLAAHTLCVALNWLTGEAEPLQIKHLAFN